VKRILGVDRGLSPIAFATYETESIGERIVMYGGVEPLGEANAGDPQRDACNDSDGCNGGSSEFIGKCG
jgi:hypothetical protein